MTASYVTNYFISHRFVDAGLTLVHKAGVKELSPTTDSNLVHALMSLIDCQIDEFKDEAKINQLEEREIITWLEVRSIWRRMS